MITNRDGARTSRVMLPEALYDLLLDNIAELKRALFVRDQELTEDQFERLQREINDLGKLS